jgi:hypothetical protein
MLKRYYYGKDTSLGLSKGLKRVGFGFWVSFEKTRFGYKERSTTRIRVPMGHGGIPWVLGFWGVLGVF